MTPYRAALPLIVAAFYGGLFLLRAVGLDGLYENLLYGLGIVPFKFPFVDAHAILSAAQSPVGQQIARACLPASAGPVPRPRV